jgi:hypothetical protein
VAGNERALSYWEMYLDNAAPGSLAPLDAPLLARLCLALAYADEATERIAQAGMLVNAEYGSADPEPLHGGAEPADRDRAQAGLRAGAAAGAAQPDEAEWHRC